MDPWHSPEGERWLYFPQYGEWHGWMPGEDGLFVYTVAEFRRYYPQAPPWDAGALVPRAHYER